MTTVLNSLLSGRLPTSLWGPNKAGTAPALEYPLTPVPKVMVLGWNFRPERNVTCISDWRVKPCLLDRAEALAASLRDLLEIAEWAVADRVNLQMLSFPILVLSQPGEWPLSTAQHDMLWRIFGLPVLEQIRERGGALLAFECEAREGFHVTCRNIRIPQAEPLDGQCPCGLSAPRIKFSAAVSSSEGSLVTTS